MAEKKVKVSLLQPKKGSEEAYFAERDRKLLEACREKAAKEANKKYTEEHKYHCFRCGTKSLVEIDEGNVKIDVCVNENCGALHLDPGELKDILNNQESIPSVRGAFLSIFKK